MTDRTVLEINDETQAIDRVRRWRPLLPGILSIIWVCGHNPQRLLTDQRSEEEKFRNRFFYGIGAMFGEPYRPYGYDIDEDDFSLMFPRASTFHQGGTITGRQPSREPIPIRHFGGEVIMPLLPNGDAVMPMRLVELLDRRHRSMFVPRHFLEISADSDRVVAAMEQAGRAIAEVGGAFCRDIKAYKEAMMNLVLFVPGTNGRRIDYLRRSPDPRQRKRGNRLADKLSRVRRFRYRKD